MDQFFFVFYFCVNLGALISTFVTPILRENVHCFGEDSCFTLAFGFPASLMIIAIGQSLPLQYVLCSIAAYFTMYRMRSRLNFLMKRL